MQPPHPPLRAMVLPSMASACNPLVALQSLLSGDVVPTTQRIQAAYQLEAYLRALKPTPELLPVYEPYLPVLTAVLGTDDCELQTSVLTMLQTLSSHNPSGMADWMTRHLHVGNEPWLVQWSYALVLQTEEQVPRFKKELKDEELKELEELEEITTTLWQWDDTSLEKHELDHVVTQVMLLWRTLLDRTDDAALVNQVVTYLQNLMRYRTDTEQWQSLLLKKLQLHFVDIADVLIGWMMSTNSWSLLR